jgi:hypothetical protein
MKKNRTKDGVAIRFAEKLVNCNALLCCTKNSPALWKKEEDLQKENRRKL